MARPSKAISPVKSGGAVIPIKPGDVAKLPDYLKSDQHRGSENVGVEDLVIPRLEIVQALSPCRKRSDAVYIEGATEGMLFNSLTRELYGESVIVIPVLFRKEYLLWRDREKGGGFAGAHPTQLAANERRQEQEVPDDWEALETAQHFVLIVKDAAGTTEEAVLSMARTKLKISRQLNSLVRLNGADRFSRAYVVATAEESGAKGDYYNFNIKNFGFPDQEIYRRAEKLWTDIERGAIVIEADASTEDDVSGGTQDKIEF